MRDPKRIKKFCDELAKTWEEECPDWRFGQLIVNMFSTSEYDPFYVEDSDMLKIIDNYFKRRV